MYSIDSFANSLENVVWKLSAQGKMSPAAAWSSCGNLSVSASCVLDIHMAVSLSIFLIIVPIYCY